MLPVSSVHLYSGLTWSDQSQTPTTLRINSVLRWIYVLHVYTDKHDELPLSNVLEQDVTRYLIMHELKYISIQFERICRLSLVKDIYSALTMRLCAE